MRWIALTKAQYKIVADVVRGNAAASEDVNGECQWGEMAISEGKWKGMYRMGAATARGAFVPFDVSARGMAVGPTLKTKELGQPRPQSNGHLYS
jgi:hypothetical protein